MLFKLAVVAHEEPPHFSVLFTPADPLYPPIDNASEVVPHPACVQTTEFNAFVVTYKDPFYFSVVVIATHVALPVFPPKDKVFSDVPHPDKAFLARFNELVVTQNNPEYSCYFSVMFETPEL